VRKKKMADKNWAILTNWRVGDTWAAPTFYDNGTLHNGNTSVRMEKGADPNLSREILLADHEQPDWTPNIKVGDHIVFKVWFKTNPSTIGDNTPASGIRFGIDFSSRAAGGRITGVQSPDGAYWTVAGGHPANQVLNFLNFGKDWEQRTMDFIVQAYPADPYGGTFPPGQIVAPDCMTPWVQVWSDVNGNADDAMAFFADTELYINPTTKSSSGCFIATACGTSNLHLSTLRRFRDQYLPVPLVHAYYRGSPPLAERLRRHENVKKVFRKVIEWLTYQLKKNLSL
jgi:hypothetical protein